MTYLNYAGKGSTTVISEEIVLLVLVVSTSSTTEAFFCAPSWSGYRTPHHKYG